jgi:hypothetical protein
MTGMRWPHQPKPRHVGGIVDDQVKIWSLKLDERKEIVSEDKLGAAQSRPEGIPKDTNEQKIADRLGFSYWGDAISTELFQLMRTDEHCDAYFFEGMNDEPKESLGKTESDQQADHPTRKRRAPGH